MPEPEAGQIDALPGNIIDFEASENITRGQAVYISGDDKVAPATDTTKAPIGVSLQTVSAGERVAVVVGKPIIYVVAGAAIDAGDYVKPTNEAGKEGRMVPIARDGSAEDYIGVAVDSASGNGDLIRIIVRPGIVGPSGA